MTENAVAVQTPLPMVLTADAIKEHVNNIATLMRDVLKKGEHYGTIPGVKAKEGEKEKLVLHKSGAEKIGLMFGLVPTFTVEIQDFERGHREYRISCKLSTRGGDLIAEGVGSCATLESKYRYRQSARKCPSCGAEAIIKGKEEYGGGWVCFAKRGGCGSKWSDGAAEIEKQEAGKSENPDIADVYNTCLKMGKKRAHVDAIITATGASDIFTQDVDEDLEEAQQQRAKAASQQQAQQAPPAPKETAPAAPKAQDAASTAAAATSKVQPAAASSVSKSAPSAARPAPGAGTSPAATKPAAPATSDPAKAEAGALCEEMRKAADGDVALAIWYAFPTPAERISAYRKCLAAIDNLERTMGGRTHDVLAELKLNAGFKEAPRRDAKGNAMREDLPGTGMVHVYINNLTGREEHAPAGVHDDPDQAPF